MPIIYETPTFLPFFQAASARLVMRTKFDEKHEAAMAPCESNLPTSSIRLFRTSASDPDAPYNSMRVTLLGDVHAILTSTRAFVESPIRTVIPSSPILSKLRLQAIIFEYLLLEGVIVRG